MTAYAEMPQYQSHKKVWALKISDVKQVRTDTTTDENPIVLVTFEGEFSAREFNLHGKPTPKAGWYFIQYQDGYESFSPPEAFESGYRKIDRGEVAKDAKDSKPVAIIQMGRGNMTCNWGTYKDKPAIFLEPAEVTGKTGELAPTTSRSAVIPGGYVIQFNDPNGALIIIQDIVSALTGMVNTSGNHKTIK